MRFLYNGVFCGIVAISSLGCAVLSPPPLMSQLAGTIPNAPGDMRVMIVAGFGVSVLSGSGFGGEFRFEGGVSPGITVGGGLGGGYNWDSTEETRRKQQASWIYGLRTWGRFNPEGTDKVALTTAAGISGTNTGTVALTFDGSAMFGGVFNANHPSSGQPFRLAPYGGPTAAISIPLRQGAPVLRSKYFLNFGPDGHSGSIEEPVDYSTTVFLGMQGGLAADSGSKPGWTGALELTLLHGFSKTQSSTILAITTGQGARVKR